MNPNTAQGAFMQNNFYGGIPMGGQGPTIKKRPTTASRKGGNMPLAFGA